jgi:hypothetical protein
MCILRSVLHVSHGDHPCRDVYGVQQLANAVDRSQMILLRANFMSKCAYPEYQVSRNNTFESQHVAHTVNCRPMGGSECAWVLTPAMDLSTLPLASVAK